MNQSISHVMFAIHWVPLLLGVGCCCELVFSQNWVFQTNFLWLCFWSSLFWVKTESNCNEGNQSTNHVIFAVRWLPLLLLLGVGSWLLLASVSQN